MSQNDVPSEATPILGKRASSWVIAFYQRTVHFWLRRPLAARPAIEALLFLRQSHLSSENSGSHRPLFLEGEGIPLQEPSAIRRIQFVRSFESGLALFSEGLWPIAFSGVLLADLIRLAWDAQSGSVEQIFLGTSTHESTLTSSWGSNLPNTVAYWSSMSALLAMYLGAGIANTLDFYIQERKQVLNLLTKLPERFIEQYEKIPKAVCDILGIKRSDAEYDLLQQISKIKHLLVSEVQAYISNQYFFNYLKNQSKISATENFNRWSLRQNCTTVINEEIIKSYIQYAFSPTQLLQRHPAILQALAAVYKIQLNLWVLEPSGELVPYPGYGSYEPHPVSTKRVDMVCHEEYAEHLIVPSAGLNINNVEEDENDNYSKIQKSNIPEKLLHLQWNGSLSRIDRDSLYESISTQAQSSNGLRSYFALASLADIADSYHPRDLARLENNDASLGDYRTQARHFLQSAAQAEHPLWYRTYARYLLWTLGESVPGSRLQHLFFTSLVLYRLYTQLRLGEFFVQRFLGLYDYLEVQAACEQTGKQYVYLFPRGTYACQVCPDEPSVFYGDASDPQICLDAFLSQSQTPADIVAKFQRLLPQGGVKRIDLSEQNWLDWTEIELDEVLSTLSFSKSPILLDLSNSVMSLQSPSVSRLNIISQALRQNMLRGLYLNQQNLFDTADVLLPAIENNTALEVVEFSNTQLAGKTSICMIDSLSKNNRLQKIDLSQNLLGNEALSAWHVQNSSNSLINLNLAKNDFSDFENFTYSFPPTLSALDLSQSMSVEDSSWSTLGNALPNTRLKKLCLNEVDADAFTIDSIFMPSSGRVTALREIEWSAARMTDTGYGKILINLANTSVEVLTLEQNALKEIGLIENMDLLSKTNVQILKLSQNSVDASSWCGFFSRLNNTNIHTLDISKTNLGDQGLEALNCVPANASLALKDLNLSENHLTSSSIKTLINWIERFHVRTLNISKNFLGAGFVEQLSPLLAKNDMEFLDVSETGVDSEDILTLAQKLPNSKLRVLAIQNNPNINKNACQTLVKTLAFPVNKDIYQLFPSQNSLRRLPDATAQTRLEKLYLDLDPMSGMALCRILPQTNISNSFDWSRSQVAPNTCLIQFSAQQPAKRALASSNIESSASMIFLSPFVLGLIVISSIVFLCFLYEKYQARRKKILDVSVQDEENLNDDFKKNVSVISLKMT